MRKLILATLAASAAATPALAQDASFSGPRAEVIAGWDHANSGADGEMHDGLTYGGAIGYDLQRGNTVFGVEGEITGSTLKQSTQTAPDTRFTARVGRDLYVGGRVGVAVSPNTLIYAKAGYTNLREQLEIQSPTVDQRYGAIEGGYRLGAGAELKLTDKAYLKTEYRFSDYGNDNRHQVVGGLGIRF